MIEPMANEKIAGQLHQITKHLTSEPAQKGARRYRVTTPLWMKLIARLGRDLDLMALWADHTEVHMAVFEPAGGDFIIASHDIVDGKFPSVAASHAPALLAERIIKDLNGVIAEDLPDQRPWIDHGQWPLTKPLAEKPGAAGHPAKFEFHGAEGEGLHEIAVGPVHAGIIEPGHFRFFCAGETVVRLEVRLGYTHKGIEKLLEGKTPQEAAPIMARISGDSTVAYSVAFARAIESAVEVDIPERAHWLRALMGELERLANHFGDIGAICNDAAFALLHVHFGLLREDVLRASASCFGHRLMMDCVIPGGVTKDIDQDDVVILMTLLGGLRTRLPRLIELYDNTPSLQDRTRNTGYLDPVLAHRFAAGGYVGRGSGRNFDARQKLGYQPYESLNFDVPVGDQGDVNARVWSRINEVEQSISLCEQIIRDIPDGAVKTELPNDSHAPAQGVALTEGFRGDIMVWADLDEQGKLKRCYARDPSLFHWPLLLAAIKDNIVADFPLCNKSFNCSYSGSDL